MRGAILKSIGYSAGTPDILVIDGGRAVWLELKAPKGRVSDAQRACHEALHLAGAIVHVVRSLDEAIAALRWSCVPLREDRWCAPAGPVQTRIGRKA